MIHAAIEYVVGELNNYLNLRSPSLSPDRVVAGSLFDLDGNVDDNAKDKVILSLVNIEEDRVYRSVEIYKKREDGIAEAIKPKIQVDLYLLFIANLADYGEALKAVGHVISFFQHRKSIDYSSVPGLVNQEGRLAFELHSMSFEQQNHLWGALGAKYMPSVMYRLAIVTVRDEQIEAEVQPVEEIVINE